MRDPAPTQEWWSAAELAASGLPDIPGTKRKVNEMAKREGWSALPGRARRRRGAGGGVEYHYSVLPLRARLRIEAVGAAPAPARPRADGGVAWARHEAAGSRAQGEAARRLNVIMQVEALDGAGLTRSMAVAEAARAAGVSEGSVWRWMRMVDGVAPTDRLAHLIDGRAVRAPAGMRSEPNGYFCALVRDSWLRNSAYTLAAAYDDAKDIWANERRNGPVPPIHQVRRWIKRSVSKPTQVFWREGAEALRKMYPSQTRTKAFMEPLECVMGDYHKFDVFVWWPGHAQPVRPQLMVWSDVYSGKLLAWRLSPTANSHTVQLVTGDLIRTWGVPRSVLIDNGREFAAKCMTGGAKTRYRFKITDEDIPGLLPLLGIHIHWATPYSGQSKPIERTFRDLCDRIARHPAFEGAYTGNSPEAKPENYGSRAIPLDEFEAVMTHRLRQHNARPDRRSEVAMGRSFDQVFEEGYARATIRRATDEQLRMFLLRAEGLRGKKDSGELKIYGTRYWSEWMYRIAGEKVVARFDAGDLAAGLEVYDLKGRYLGSAAALEDVRFLDAEAAEDHARKRNAWLRIQKAEARAAKEYSAADLAARLRGAGALPLDGEVPEAQIHQLVVPHRAAPKRRAAAAEDALREADLAERVLRLEARSPAPAEEDDPEARFARARELERAEAAGEVLTRAQADWLADYRQYSEYRAGLRMERWSASES